MVNLAQKMLDEFPERKFACSHAGCFKKYTLKQHLIRHVKLAHLNIGAKSFVKCDLCGESFTTKQNLQKHLDRKHRKFPYECHLCSEGFKKDTLLARHLFEHTGIKLLKCRHCERTFSNQTDRCRHEAKHKTFECETCERTFEAWADFVEHKKSHRLDVREFHCDLCGKVFHRRSYIVGHMKTHASLRANYQCPHCPKNYSSHCGLRHHTDAIHNLKTYDCTFPGCEAKLSTQQRLECHSYKHVDPAYAKKPKKALRRVRKDRGVKRIDSGIYEKLARLRESNDNETMTDSSNDTHVIGT